MAYLIKADHSGHANVANWGSDKASRDAGRAAFEALAAGGYTMFALDADAPRKVKEFEPETNTIAIRALQGG